MTTHRVLPDDVEAISYGGGGISRRVELPAWIRLRTTSQLVLTSLLYLLYTLLRLLDKKRNALISVLQYVYLVSLSSDRFSGENKHDLFSESPFAIQSTNVASPWTGRL